MVKSCHKVLDLFTLRSYKKQLYQNGFAIRFCCGLSVKPGPQRPGRLYHVSWHNPSKCPQYPILRFQAFPGGMLGPGVYVTRSFQKAAAYPKSLLPGEEQAILRLRVRVGKVKRIDYQHHPLQKTWHKQGYDTAWVPPSCGMVPSGLEENCVWDPRRIEVIDVLNCDGTIKNLSTFGFMPGPFGYHLYHQC